MTPTLITACNTLPPEGALSPKGGLSAIGNLLDVQNLTVSFGNKAVIHGINLAVKAGV